MLVSVPPVTVLPVSVTTEPAPEARMVPAPDWVRPVLWRVSLPPETAWIRPALLAPAALDCRMSGVDWLAVIVPAVWF